ncbi:MAG: DUF1294 domain-containing protein [Clostridia bacterium]|nr:DUF1294 domain-containing protein [Clostridia bacterium]
MSIAEYIFLTYMVLISIISVVLVIVDKLKAKNSRWRISEATLFLFAVLGGSAAMYFTMCLVRHKTQKNRFVFGIPLIFFLQCACFYAVYIL